MTLRDAAPADAVRWMATSLGLPPARSAPELLAGGFTLDELPREPRAVHEANRWYPVGGVT